MNGRYVCRKDAYLLQQLQPHLRCKVAEIIGLHEGLDDLVGLVEKMGKVVLADDDHNSVGEVGKRTCKDQYFEGEGDDGGPFIDDEGGSEMPEKAEVVDHQQDEVENIHRLNVVVVASEVPAKIDQVQSDIANTGSYHADLVRIDQKVQLRQLSETQRSLGAAQKEDDDRYQVVYNTDVVELEVFATY